MYAHRFLVYGENKKGYWTSDKVMEQLQDVVKLVNFKYPKSEGWRVVWIFDHSSCHAAMSEDALDVSHMNVKPGGKQRVIRNGFYDGKPQEMNFPDGTIISEECGVETRHMTADKMHEVLGSH